MRRGYKGLQEVIGGYKGLQEAVGCYNELPGITGVKGGYKGS